MRSTRSLIMLALDLSPPRGWRGHLSAHGVAIVPVFPPATSHLPFDGLIQLKWAFVLLCRFIPLRSSCAPLTIGNARFRDTLVCRNVDLLAS